MEIPKDALHPRAEWPDDEYAPAPETVERRCRAEWERHLHAVLPGLSRHDDGRRVIRTRDDLVEASPAEPVEGRRERFKDPTPSRAAAPVGVRATPSG
jgi:hypothetical protein